MLLGNHVGFATSSGLALPERVSGTKERRLEIEWPFTAGRQLGARHLEEDVRSAIGNRRPRRRSEELSIGKGKAAER